MAIKKIIIQTFPFIFLPISLSYGACDAIINQVKNDHSREAAWRNLSWLKTELGETTQEKNVTEIVYKWLNYSLVTWDGVAREAQGEYPKQTQGASNSHIPTLQETTQTMGQPISTTINPIMQYIWTCPSGSMLNVSVNDKSEIVDMNGKSCSGNNPTNCVVFGGIASSNNFSQQFMKDYNQALPKPTPPATQAAMPAAQPMPQATTPPVTAPVTQQATQPLQTVQPMAQAPMPATQPATQAAMPATQQMPQALNQTTANPMQAFLQSYNTRFKTTIVNENQLSDDMTKRLQDYFTHLRACQPGTYHYALFLVMPLFFDVTIQGQQNNRCMVQSVTTSPTDPNYKATTSCQYLPESLQYFNDAYAASLGGGNLSFDSANPSEIDKIQNTQCQVH